MGRPRKYPKPLSELVYEDLLGAILTGELPAGTRLQQGVIASRLGVSPIPVREAFSQLEAGGFVGRDPYHGTFVRPLSAEELVDLTETRLALETLALRRALPGMTPLQIQAADQAREAMVAERDLRQVHFSHLAMIDCLYASAERPHLLEALKGVVSRAQRYFPIYRQVQSLLPENLPTLKGYLEACARKDETEALRILDTRFRATAEAGAQLLRAARA